MILAQYTAVAIDGRALLIAGPPGSGKTSLALALIDRGATLIGDDGVALEVGSAGVWALPPPATAGLIEVRNVGIVTLRAITAPVALVLELDPDAPRFIERAAEAKVAGHAIPALHFDPRIPEIAIRAEYALSVHGIPLASQSAHNLMR